MIVSFQFISINNISSSWKIILNHLYNRYVFICATPTFKYRESFFFKHSIKPKWLIYWRYQLIFHQFSYQTILIRIYSVNGICGWKSEKFDLVWCLFDQRTFDFMFHLLNDGNSCDARSGWLNKQKCSFDDTPLLLLKKGIVKCREDRRKLDSYYVWLIEVRVHCPNKKLFSQGC